MTVTAKDRESSSPSDSGGKAYPGPTEEHKEEAPFGRGLSREPQRGCGADAGVRAPQQARRACGLLEYPHRGLGADALVRAPQEAHRGCGLAESPHRGRAGRVNPDGHFGGPDPMTSLGTRCGSSSSKEPGGKAHPGLMKEPQEAPRGHVLSRTPQRGHDADDLTLAPQSARDENVLCEASTPWTTPSCRLS